MSKSTKATSASSPSTKPTSAYTLYGMQDCPTHWNNHFKKCLVPAMNKQFKKNGTNMPKSVSKRSTMLTPHTKLGPRGHVFKISQHTPHPLYPNHGCTKHDYSMAHTERPFMRPICSARHVPKLWLLLSVFFCWP